MQSKKLKEEDILGLISSWDVSIRQLIMDLSLPQKDLEAANETIAKTVKTLNAIQGEINQAHMYLLDPTKKLLFTPKPLTIDDVSAQLASKVGVYLTLFDEEDQMLRKPILVTEDISKAEAVKYLVDESVSERAFELHRKMLHIKFNGSSVDKWIPSSVAKIRMVVSNGKTAEYIELPLVPVDASENV